MVMVIVECVGQSWFGEVFEFIQTLPLLHSLSVLRDTSHPPLYVTVSCEMDPNAIVSHTYSNTLFINDTFK